MSAEPLVVIPARLASSRLPGKPLKKIGNKTLIEHCVDSARKVVQHPYVVSDSMDVIDVVGHGAITCNIDLETGTDRVAFYVEQNIGWDKAPDWIINVQGDMPFGTAPFIRRLISATEVFEHADMITIVAETNHVCFRSAGDNYSAWERVGGSVHIGMYAYRKEALKRFYDAREDEKARVGEKAANLEQCRSSALNMAVRIVETSLLPPLEVNTQADLDRINEIVNACAGLGNPGFTADEAASLALAGGG